MDWQFSTLYKRTKCLKTVIYRRRLGFKFGPADFIKFVIYQLIRT